ncbi:feruloyl-CoA synthase [Zoogloea sp.]|jgi:feruloyl-CoA synthase|uniref:feruloyl-CoA synthase n=1 Tax=Zoogloea sp. TaxID=49181 RepID=UPI001B576202|nr:feruloyl-CoA synthase [Zoogloea sp.]MBP7444921.1 feruloyl-CoA synthase [Zoogloea sp.]HPI59988.1 feruloyl-CoA synthase [Zoogloea sp.]
MSFFDNPGMLAPPRVTRIDLSRGGFILACSDPLEEVTRCIGDWLEYWAARTPNALFLAERDAEGEWVRMTYAQVREQVGKLAQGLLDLGIGPTAPVVCLSDNSLDQALLTLATMHIGRPFATVSSAYSRLAKDYTKVATILQELAPGAVYAGDGAVYASAIRASAVSCPVILSTNAYQLDGSLSLAELMRTRETPAVMAEFAKITPETHAKYLLTSGSTGRPKIAINTHRMLCANQKQIQQSWPFLKDEKPVIVSWLPWSHTFGANHNFNLVLCNGGSFYIDEGRPVPGLMEKSVRNLREVQPNLYFNVPRGFDALIAFLEQDESFARDFFGRLRAVFYAAAALPQSTWDRLERSAQKVLGEKVWFTSAWGATESSPLLTNVHWRLDGPGCIGLPVAGTSIKFLPNGDKLEMRVKGPQVFPGYLNNPEKTAEAFDEDGYYKIGDAGLLIDPARPEKGIAFNGRVAEDFKLTTGTWVSVGTLRVRAVTAFAPFAQDVVVTGHDRDEVGLLVFPTPAAKDVPTEQLHAHVREGLRKLKAEGGGGSSQSPTRAMLLDEPPSMDAGEITDKGYINQRAVLARRADDVLSLHTSPKLDRVVFLK